MRPTRTAELLIIFLILSCSVSALGHVVFLQNAQTGRPDMVYQYNNSDFCLIDGSNCNLGGGGSNSTISGSGSAGQVAYWNGTAVVTSKGTFFFTSSTDTLTVTTINATANLTVGGQKVCLANGTNCIAIANGTNGINGLNGTSITAIYVLSNGSLQINLSSNVNYTSGNLTGPQGSQGNQGVQGNTGPTGGAGNNGTRINVTGTIPNSTVPWNPPVTGDLDLYNVTSILYQYNGTNWTAIANLSGQAGPQGSAGSNGAAGSPGSNGTGVLNATVLANGSLQIGLTNGTILVLGNVTGATGAQGNTGNTGATGAAGTNATANWTIAISTGNSTIVGQAAVLNITAGAGILLNLVGTNLTITSTITQYTDASAISAANGNLGNFSANNASLVHLGDANKTLVYCGNITGATSNLCTITSGAGGGVVTFAAADKTIIAQNGTLANASVNMTEMNRSNDLRYCLGNGSNCPTGVQTLYYASVASNISGILGGALSNTQSYHDSAVLYTNESILAGTDLRLNFTGVSTFDYLDMREQYAGLAANTLSVQLWNYNTTSWQTITNIMLQTDNATIHLFIFDTPYINQSNGSVVQLRITGSAVGANTFLLDYIALDSINSVNTNSIDGEGTAGAIAYWVGTNTIGSSIMTQAGNVTTVAGNITANTFIGSLPCTNITGATSNLCTISTASSLVNNSDANLNTLNVTVKLNVASTNATTSIIAEGTNLYYTDARAALAVQNSTILRNNTNAIFNTLNATQLGINGLGNQTPVAIQGSINDYLQVNIQNTNTGNLSSSDLSVTGAGGNATNGYVNIGCNGYNYTTSTAPYYPGGPWNCYVLQTGNSTLLGGLYIGTLLNSNISIIVNSTSIANFTLNGLDVKGTVTATTFSGAGTSLTGTAASLTAGTATSATTAVNLAAGTYNYGSGSVQVNANGSNLLAGQPGSYYINSTVGCTSNGTNCPAAVIPILNVTYLPMFRSEIMMGAGPAGISLSGMNSTARCMSFPVEKGHQALFDNVNVMVDNTNASIVVYIATYNCTSGNTFDCTTGNMLINYTKFTLGSSAMQGIANTTGNWTLPAGNYVTCVATNDSNAQAGILRGSTGSAGTGSTLRLSSITMGIMPQSATFTTTESDAEPYVFAYRKAGVTP